MSKTVIIYFGTDIHVAGHYFWDVYSDRLEYKGFDYFKKLPFNPEDLIKSGTPFGTVEYLVIGDYSIITISGSPKDKRNGTKSVFISPRIVSYEVLKGWILKTPSLRKIIDTMPFEVNWI